MHGAWPCARLGRAIRAHALQLGAASLSCVFVLARVVFLGVCLGWRMIQTMSVMGRVRWLMQGVTL